MAVPSEWTQSYQTNFSDVTQAETTTATATSSVVGLRNNNNSIHDQSSRGSVGVSKPIRRRSRVSRRTPTTLLNTDPTNFRAMVQHFTGGPSMHGGAANANLNSGHHMNSAPASGFGHVQYSTNEQAMQQEQMLMMIRNMHGGGGSGRGGGVSSHAPPGSSSANENRNFDQYTF